jgi:hypothetical protein
MFNPEYINELINGKLSEEGYAHFLRSISTVVRKFRWPNFIVVSDVKRNSIFWSSAEIKELTHQFFEWIITKGKLFNLSKIPHSYLSYYFTQILISFISNSIKNHQQKEGLSFEKCRELVLLISKEDFTRETINGVEYIFNNLINKQDILPQDEIDHTLKYVSKIPIPEATKHFKPLIKMAIGDILNTLDSPIPIEKLINAVYNLLDQKSFVTLSQGEQSANSEVNATISPSHMPIIKLLLQGVSKDDARLLADYLFKRMGEVSLSELALKYKLPKSTLHHKIEMFRKKIFEAYTPENEEDGLLFIQNIFFELDNQYN